MAQNNYNWPINPTTVNSGPVQFETNGVPTTVNLDTVTPANSTPLPVSLYDGGGVIVDSATAANQVLEIGLLTSIDDKTPGFGAAGSFAPITLSGTTAQTITKPANALGFILLGPSTNTDNIRWCIGATASSTNGMLSEPGRDTGYVPCAADISVCATASGTNAVTVQWVLNQ